MFPNVEFDTFVTSPSDMGDGIGAPTILGYNNSEPGPGSWGGPQDTRPGLFSVAWGDIVVDPPGTYELARLTFPLGVFPDVINSMPRDEDPSIVAQVSPDATAPIPDIPEPALSALIPIAAVLALRRRNSCAFAHTAGVLAIGLTLVMSNPVSAQITAFWQQNTITPNAIAADPALANMQSWSVWVTTTGNWASAGLLAPLPTGNLYYNPSAGGKTKPSAATIAIFPNVEFDTYVTSPGDQGGGVGAPNILGFVIGPGPGSWGGPNDPRPGQFDLQWGDLVVDPPGTYEIARLTFPLGVLPDIYNPPGSYYSATSQVIPDATTVIPDIPEPTATGLVFMSAGFLAYSRRWRFQSPASSDTG